LSACFLFLLLKLREIVPTSWTFFFFFGFGFLVGVQTIFFGRYYFLFGLLGLLDNAMAEEQQVVIYR
jgi:hypothetical protein